VRFWSKGSAPARSSSPSPAVRRDRVDDPGLAEHVGKSDRAPCPLDLDQRRDLAGLRSGDDDLHIADGVAADREQQ